MNKIFLIIQREYLSRVKKKSFIVMTILGPLLIAGIYIVPILLAKTDDEKKTVCVVDETGLFYEKLTGNSSVNYIYHIDFEKAKEELGEGDFSGLLYIPKEEYGIPTNAYILYTKDQPSMFTKGEVQSAMQTILRNDILLQAHNISKKDFDMINNTKIKLHAQNIQTGKDSFVEVKTYLGIFMGVLIYMFIFLFGSQVMNGVMEEKSSRIVEVMISSVRPFQLMMGKIVGVALVGLTQFLLWVLLSGILIGVTQVTVLGDTIKDIKPEQITSLSRIPTTAELTPDSPDSPVSNIVKGLLSIDYSIMLGSFLFYFLVGYLFYATLFACIGSIVENQSDSQQFMLPVTVPLILSLMSFVSIIKNPSGPIAFWFSMIPFTSPITMLIRIPFGVPLWQIYLSGAILILSFIGSTWLSAKIYRVGILMYGKKITYAELWKWLKYKN